MFDRALGKLLIVAVLAFGMSGTSAYGILALFSIEDTPVAPNDPNGGPPRLFRINPADGSTISSVPMTLAGQTVVGAGGLARNPADGDLYAMLRLRGQEGMELVTIDPVTGVANSRGNTQERWTGIAFDNAGGPTGLFGITEDPNAVISNGPKTLYSIDGNTGAVGASVEAFTPGFEDDALALNPDDGLIYHLGGGFFDALVFETVDTLGPAPTLMDIPGIDAGTIFDEAQSMVWDPNRGAFLVKHDSFGDGEFFER